MDYSDNEYPQNKDYSLNEVTDSNSNDKSVSDEPSPRNIQRTLEHLARSGNMQNSADWLRKSQNRQIPGKENKNIFPENELEENSKDYNKNNENDENEENIKRTNKQDNWADNKGANKEEEDYNNDDERQEERIGLCFCISKGFKL